MGKNGIQMKAYSIGRADSKPAPLKTKPKSAPLRGGVFRCCPASYAARQLREDSRAVIQEQNAKQCFWNWGNDDLRTQNVEENCFHVGGADDLRECASDGAECGA